MIKQYEIMKNEKLSSYKDEDGFPLLSEDTLEGALQYDNYEDFIEKVINALPKSEPLFSKKSFSKEMFFSVLESEKVKKAFESGNYTNFVKMFNSYFETEDEYLVKNHFSEEDFLILKTLMLLNENEKILNGNNQIVLSDVEVKAQKDEDNGYSLEFWYQGERFDKTLSINPFDVQFNAQKGYRYYYLIENITNAINKLHEKLKTNSHIDICTESKELIGLNEESEFFEAGKRDSNNFAIFSNDSDYVLFGNRRGRLSDSDFDGRIFLYDCIDSDKCLETYNISEEELNEIANEVYVERLNDFWLDGSAKDEMDNFLRENELHTKIAIVEYKGKYFSIVPIVPDAESSGRAEYIEGTNDFDWESFVIIHKPTPEERGMILDKLESIKKSLMNDIKNDIETYLEENYERKENKEQDQKEYDNEDSKQENESKVKQFKRR